MIHKIENGTLFTSRMKPKNRVPREMKMEDWVADNLASSIEDGKMWSGHTKGYDPSIVATTHDGASPNRGLHVYSRTHGIRPREGGFNGFRGNSRRMPYLSVHSETCADKYGDWRIRIRPEKLDEFVSAVRLAAKAGRTVLIETTHDGHIIVSS